MVNIEQIMRVVYDLKKKIHFNKGEGSWYWCDSDQENSFDSWVGPFPRFIDCAYDIAEPYLSMKDRSRKEEENETITD